MGTWALSRRTFLRGAGTTVALPLLEAMTPIVRAAETPVAPPKRMAFFYVPNGIHMPDWTPQKVGADFDLPPILEPLAEVKDDLLVLSGLAHDKARSNGDGGGDHARSVATFLTGSQAHKTGGKDIRVGMSVDQVAAEKIGSATRLPSLELGCDRGRTAGSCDSGYSCVYSGNISWRTPSTPMIKEVNPRSVFDRLFPNAVPSDEVAPPEDRRERYRKSILDFVAEDARRLKDKLGKTDRRKLDEYLASIRELEKRIDNPSADAEPDVQDVAAARPAGVPREYAEHVRLMGDLMVKAFQLDQTRICTFMFADAGSNRSYAKIGAPEGHHSLSHHRNDKNKIAKIAKINRFHVEQFAYVLGQLKTIREGDGTLLDNSMIVYGSGISDGNRHHHHNLPVLLAGRAGGSITSGRHVQYDGEVPLMNLYLALLDRVGASVDRLGDSTGELGQLSV